MTTQTITTNLHDKTHRHHLFTAAVICALEIALTLGVETVVVHLLVTIAVFGRDVSEVLLSGN